MGFLSRLVSRYPGWIVAAVALLTVVGAYGVLQLNISTDVTSFFAEDDPRLVTFEWVSDTFGSSTYVLAVVSAGDIFRVPVIQALDSLTQELERVPGVANVRSITNVENVLGTPWGIEVAPIMDVLPDTDVAVERFRERVLSSDTVANRFVSDDEQHTLILIQLARNVDSDAVVQAVRDVTSRYAARLTVQLTGSQALTQQLNSVLKDDILRLTPLILAVIVAVLYLSFRSAAGVVLPLAAVGISVIWTLGLMGFLGVSLSQLGSAIPVVLVSVGSAYGIHVLRRFEEEWQKHGDTRIAAEQTVRSVGLAVVMSGLTTVVGFSANAFTRIVRIREFGVFMGVGVAAALLVSILFIPAVLVLVRRHNRASSRRPAPMTIGDHANSGLLERVGAWVTQRPAVPLVAAAVLTVVSFTGFARLQVDTDYLRFFDARSEARQAYQLVQDKFGGVDTVQIILEGDILEPDTLRAMETLQAELEAIPWLSGSMSVADIVKEVGQALNEDDPAYAVIPDSRAAVAQYLLLLSMSGDSTLEQFLTFDQGTAKIEVPVATTSAQERADVLRRIDELAEEILGPYGQVHVTGLPYLVDGMAELITTGQIQSLVISVAGVLVLLWIMVGSLRRGLSCLIPILLTIAINFGFMGWAGMDFDVINALVASVVVGVGIDYSIHVYSRYREESANGRQPKEAIVTTLATTGRAVLLNAAAVAAGFLVLLLSMFPPLRIFGFLVALTMGVASTAALTVLPAIFAVTDGGRPVRHSQRADVSKTT
ncbi:MAG: hypothetical protein BAA04_06015 [Firmicutes bacterium ZCTH02-B6]|nr:MAG: hypothetical protein BAA04_06015 [Firmicutes bacterium ZCTH02-B6]